MLQELSPEEKKDWLRLYRSENVGPITFRNLLDYYETPTEALRHISEFAKRGGRKKEISVCSKSAAQQEIEKTEAIGGKMIAFCEPDYPELLRLIEDAPPIISVLGYHSLLNKKCVAMVGTRNASLNGKNMARKLAFDLCQSDYVVVSGLARGIDAAAHEGALANTTNGGTVAVVGTGVDVVYPAENKALYDKIAERGVIVSEFALGSQPFPGNFPRRNRIISGLSSGLVVIEANEKSGSLISAELAKEQRRQVFAVPGCPLDPRSRGPNSLLKRGAKLVEEAKDIIDVLDPIKISDMRDLYQEKTDMSMVNPEVSDVTDARGLILRNLSPETILVDELIRECHLSASVVNVVLVELELAGRIERFPGNRVSLIADSMLG